MTTLQLLSVSWSQITNLNDLNACHASN